MIIILGQISFYKHLLSLEVTNKSKLFHTFYAVQLHPAKKKALS